MREHTSQHPERRDRLAQWGATLVDLALVALALTAIGVVHTGYSLWERLTRRTGWQSTVPRKS